MYEKNKVLNKAGDVNARAGDDEDNCALCSRPRSVVICGKCYFVVDNVRARKRCAHHPRVLYHMDINFCTRCKSQELLEVGVDDIPAHLAEILAEPELPPSRPSFGSSAAIDNTRASGAGTLTVQIPSSPSSQGMKLPSPASPMAVDEAVGSGMQPYRGLDFEGLQLQASPALAKGPSAAMEGNPRRGKSRVVLPPPPISQKPRMEQPSASPPPAPPVERAPQVLLLGPCNCNRKINYLLCSGCGYLAPGEKKYIRCPQHPEVKQGINFCPECGLPSARMDEY